MWGVAVTTPRARLLALRPPRPPLAALAPEPLGVKGGHPYERRLSKVLRLAWPVVEEAVRAAGQVVGVDPEALTQAVAIELFSLGSVERPADDPASQWVAVEHRLVALMAEKGLDLDLACAQLGLDVERVKVRCTEDPLLAGRLEIAWLRGTAKLHGAVWDAAMQGKERSALALLQVRDSRFAPTVKVEISEGQILSSGAFQRVLSRILAVFDMTVPEDVSEEFRRGWVECQSTMRSRAAEELGAG